MKAPLFSLICLTLVTACKQNTSTMTDAEGNRYPVILHDGQLWMAANLRTKQDFNGKPVPFFYPNDNPIHEVEYGLLYDYATACHICPTGWRLPTNEDWEKLLPLDDPEAAKAFKSTDLWGEDENSDASGFSAKPTGYANTEHPNLFGERTDFWSKTRNADFAWTFIFEIGKTSIRKAEQHPEYAYAVRCVKD